jgi:hypothetical protein
MGILVVVLEIEWKAAAGATEPKTKTEIRIK